jgi:hypothetical protein
MWSTRHNRLVLRPMWSFTNGCTFWRADLYRSRWAGNARWRVRAMDWSPGSRSFSRTVRRLRLRPARKRWPGTFQPSTCIRSGLGGVFATTEPQPAPTSSKARPDSYYCSSTCIDISRWRCCVLYPSKDVKHRRDRRGLRCDTALPNSTVRGRLGQRRRLIRQRHDKRLGQCSGSGIEQYAFRREVDRAST